MNRKQHRALLGALPLLAQTMGQKMGVKVVMQGEKAFTDGNTIVIPALPFDDPDIADLVSGYLDHEAGHVRETDFDEIEKSAKNPFLKKAVNVLEDIRIEKAMANIYPGCRTNLAKLVKKLVRRGRFAPVPAENPGKLVSGHLLYSLRSKVLGQTGLDELAEDAADKLDSVYPGLRAELDAITDSIGKAESTAECGEMGVAVIEAMKKYIQEPPTPPSPPDKPEEEDLEDQESEQPESEGEGQGDGEQEEDEQGSGGTGSADTEPDTESGTENSSQENEAGASGQDSEAEEPETEQPANGGWNQDQARTLQEALDASEEDLVQTLGEIIQEDLDETADTESRSTSSCASAEPAGSADAFALDESRVLATTNALRVRLNGLLQASISVRNLPRRTGHKLDSKKFARLRAGVDQKVFRGRNIRQGINTAVHLLVDRSGSMQGDRMTVANDTMLAVKLALEGISRVNLGVSAFPGAGNDWNQFVPLLKHGERKLGSKFGMSAEGGTPLVEALWGVARQMIALPEERKIIIVITDGEPCAPYTCNKTIQTLERVGFELVGIGIELPNVASFFHNHCVIQDVAELPVALFGQLERLLT